MSAGGNFVAAAFCLKSSTRRARGEDRDGGGTTQACGRESERVSERDRERR